MSVKKLRLVVLCPHFDPDIAPTGVVMTRIVQELAKRGHELHVVDALIRAVGDGDRNGVAGRKHGLPEHVFFPFPDVGGRRNTCSRATRAAGP